SHRGTEPQRRGRRVDGSARNAGRRSRPTRIRCTNDLNPRRVSFVPGFDRSRREATPIDSHAALSVRALLRDSVSLWQKYVTVIAKRSTTRAQLELARRWPDARTA